MIACVPSENNGDVDDECGIFVAQSGKDTGPRTKAMPVHTFARAIELAEAAQKPIYACAESFLENVTVPEGTIIYGGLNCTSSWEHVGSSTKTTLSLSNGIPLMLVESGSGTVHIEDVAAMAANASTPGESSVAV